MAIPGEPNMAGKSKDGPDNLGDWRPVDFWPRDNPATQNGEVPQFPGVEVGGLGRDGGTAVGLEAPSQTPHIPVDAIAAIIATEPMPIEPGPNDIANQGPQIPGWQPPDDDADD